MLRNVASQKWRVYAWDTTTGQAKTGDAANISARITKDDGSPAATNDAAPTEVDATNEKGYYYFDLTQAETSAALAGLQERLARLGIETRRWYCPTLEHHTAFRGIRVAGELRVARTLTDVAAHRVTVGRDSRDMWIRLRSRTARRMG